MELKARYRSFTVVGSDFCLHLYPERSENILKGSWSLEKNVRFFVSRKIERKEKKIPSLTYRSVDFSVLSRIRLEHVHIFMMNLLISIFIMKISCKDESNVIAIFVTLCNVSQSPDFLTKVTLLRARQENYNS